MLHRVAERQALEDAGLLVAHVEAAAAEEVAPLAADQAERDLAARVSLTMNWPAALMTFELKLPHSPRSPVITMSSGRPLRLGRHPQQRVGILLDARHQAVQHLQHALRERPRGDDAILRALEARGRDHLHRLGDLLRRLDRADPATEVDEGRHGARRPARCRGPASPP